MANPLIVNSAEQSDEPKAYINISIQCGTNSEGKPVYVELPWGINLDLEKKGMSKHQRALVTHLLERMQTASEATPDSPERLQLTDFEVPVKCTLRGGVLTDTNTDELEFKF